MRSGWDDGTPSVSARHVLLLQSPFRRYFLPPLPRRSSAPRGEKRNLEEAPVRTIGIVDCGA